MSGVDKELARAVAENEAAQATAPLPAVTASVLPPRAPKRNLGLLFGLLVMASAILTLVFSSFEKSAVYSKGVDDLLKQKTKLTGRSVRVEGTLVKGSLVRRDDPCEYRFRMQKQGAELAVRYAQCIVPDTFRDMPGMDVAVTAEGRLNEEGHFEATQIMAKCPSKYEMKERAGSGEKAPHAPEPESRLGS